MAAVIVFFAVLVFAGLVSKLAFKTNVHTAGECKSYACGEDVKENRMQPDYSEFFPFAFFFTVLHVIALMLATLPVESMNTFVIAIIYILCAIAGLTVIFRKA